MNETEKIQLVKEEISNIIPNLIGVTLGGSRMHDLNDMNSDVEMYFYYDDKMPSEESITNTLEKMNARHKRSDSFLWANNEPWGPHSFFLLDDLYFEIGYRKYSNILNKIENYLNGDVEPKKDCHDLGIGYMMSGLASSVSHEKILKVNDNILYDLKNKAKEFPETLYLRLVEEYLNTALYLYENKLLSAANREDIYFFESLSNRIVRSLMVIAFANGKEHFPGDKWNEQLLLKSDWKYKEDFLKCLKEFMLSNASRKNEMLLKRKQLGKAIELVKRR